MANEPDFSTIDPTLQYTGPNECIADRQQRLDNDVYFVMIAARLRTLFANDRGQRCAFGTIASAALADNDGTTRGA